jgi:hypothetical protein
MKKIIKITHDFNPEDAYDLALRLLKDFKVEYKIIDGDGELIIEYYVEPKPHNIQKPIN